MIGEQFKPKNKISNFLVRNAFFYTNSNISGISENLYFIPCMVDEKTMIRNRYNRIPHSSPDAIQERNINKRRHKVKQHKRKDKRSALT